MDSADDDGTCPVKPPAAYDNFAARTLADPERSNTAVVVRYCWSGAHVSVIPEFNGERKYRDADN